MKLLICALLVVVGGCAGLSETALPRAGHTLDGLKSFYLAVCEAPPAGKEQLCEDAAQDLNAIGEFYNQVNDLLGEDD